MTCDSRGKHTRCLTDFFAISMSLNVRGLTNCLQKEEDAEVKAIGGKMDSCRHSSRSIDAILLGLHASRGCRM